MAESSSAPPSPDKPVIVRVKRKAFQSPLDAFWLEIHERPLKRPLLDLGKLSISDPPLIDSGKLSISDSSSSRVEILKTKKILVRHVETVTSSKDTLDVLRSFVPSSSGELISEENIEERRRSLKTVNRQDRSLVKAKQRQEVLSRHARFEQIWRSRKGKKEAPEGEAIYDMCRLYDVVRVDVEEHIVEVHNDKDTDLNDRRMMAQYLPLLREVLPTAAEEIEDDIHDFMPKQASSDGYVYDFYTVEEDVNEAETDSAIPFPSVQVDDLDDYYDGPDDTEYETDDSNAEKNPLNDYPEEEISEDEDEPEEEISEDEDEDEVTSRSSDEKSEGESVTSENQSEELERGSQVSYAFEESETYDWSDNANQYFEYESHSEEDDKAFW